MAELFTLPFVQALDDNAVSISGATLTFYRSGSTTEVPVYANATLSTSLGATVTANAAGRFVPIYLDNNLTYRAVLKNAAGVTISDVDPIGDFGDGASIVSYGADPTGVADSTAAINAALTANNKVLVPSGTYRITGPLVVKSGNQLVGDGDGASIITTDQNINMAVCVNGTYRAIIRDIQWRNTFPVSNVAGPSFTATTVSGNSIITSVSSTSGLYKGMAIAGAGIPAGSYIRYINGSTIRLGNAAGAYVNATANGAGVSMSATFRQGPTKHHIYFNNAGWTRIQDCYFFNLIDDADYSPNNLGGIWFDRDTLTQFFINEIHDCWIDRGEIKMGTSDSNIRNCHVWGIGMDAAIRLNAPGISVMGCNASNGQIAAIVISATVKESFGSLNHNIVGNNIDSGGRWQDGYGILATQPNNVAIVGNRINICAKGGVYLDNPFGVAVTGNQFNNNNLDGLSFSDVEIVGTAFQPSNVTVTGNSFAQDSAKTPSTGWAIRETNGGFFPQGCAYTGNSIGIGANYQSPAFSIVTPITDANIANVSGNIGGGMDAGITGTFTPTLVGATTPGAPTYIAQYGMWTLTGKQLTWRLGVGISAVGGCVGNMSIRGLPVAAASGAGQHACGPISSFGGVTLAGGRTQLGGLIDANTTIIRLVASGGAGLAPADVVAGDLSATFGVTIAGSYRVN